MIKNYNKMIIILQNYSILRRVLNKKKTKNRSDIIIYIIYIYKLYTFYKA